MTPAGIETATFRFIATAVSQSVSITHWKVWSNANEAVGIRNLCTTGSFSCALLSHYRPTTQYSSTALSRLPIKSTKHMLLPPGTDNTGLFEMIVGVLTTSHTRYTWDRSICIFLFNRTTLQSLCYIPYRCSICAPFVILQTSTR